MTLTTAAMTALLHDLHIDADSTDSWPDESSSHPIYEVADDEREICSWCDCHIADDEGIDFCGRRGETLHTHCHGRGEAECSCPG